MFRLRSDQSIISYGTLLLVIAAVVFLTAAAILAIIDEVSPYIETMAETQEDAYIPQDTRHYIPWQFTAHASPDFAAGLVGVFSPQEVEISFYNGDGWAYVTGDGIRGWVYLNENIIFTGRVMGIFDAAFGERVARLEPQLVTIYDRLGGWVYIGEGRWIDLDFQPPAYVLEEFMQQFGGTLSVFYENMATGFIFRHNADRVYFGASATKAPFALYIYLKAERGETSMDNQITYTGADFWGGSGVIRHRYQIGATFTQKRLLELMLAPSDNIATRMLRRTHGYYSYREFVAGIGANPDHVQNITYSHLTANDAGIFMRETFRYIESGGNYSQHLRDNLLANRYAFIISDYPVASKSGWAANHGAAWHDMAIIYAPSPYTLSLLSSRAGNATDRQAYDAISMFIQEFNSKWFAPTHP